MQAIILAGGFGTRLQEVAGYLPKPMLPVAGKPLLEWQLERLQEQGVTEVVLCVHHQYLMISEYFGDEFLGMRLHYSIEETALGTGGAIRAALRLLKTRRPVIVLYGDAMTFADVRRMRTLHMSEERIVTRAAYRGRTGALDVSAGLYIISPWLFESYAMPKVFSFERDFLVHHMTKSSVTPYDAVRFHLDLDTPQDYVRAQAELPARLSLLAAA